jgi:hypothetical protein
MKRGKAVWALAVMLCAPAGIFVGKSGLLEPTRSVFAMIGLLAGLCLVGIGFGIWEGRRAAREGRSLSN